MTKPELIEKLKLCIQNTFQLTNRDVEQHTGMPKNSLSAYLSLKKELPDKWVVPIQNFISFAQSNMRDKNGKLPQPVLDAISATWDFKAKSQDEFNESRGWIREVWKYCLIEGITPMDLINTYKKWKQVKNDITVSEKKGIFQDTINDTRDHKSYAKPYDPNDNPIYKKKMNL